MKKIFCVLTFLLFLISSSIFSQETKIEDLEKLNIELKNKFQKLGSFTADFIATKSENQNKVHIRLIYNADEKFILYKINNINQKSDSQTMSSDIRTFLLLDFKKALNQFYIFPDKKEAWSYSTDNMLHDPFNFFMLSLNYFHEYQTNSPLEFNFDQFAPVFSLELTKEEIHCFLGVDLFEPKLNANWLKTDFLKKSKSIQKKNSKIIIQTSEENTLILDENGFFESQTIKEKGSTRKIERLNFQKRSLSYSDVLPNMKMYTLKQQYHPEFKQSLLNIMVYLSGVYLSKQEKEREKFYKTLNSNPNLMKNKIKELIEKKLQNVFLQDVQFQQFIMYMANEILQKDFTENNKNSKQGVDFPTYLKNFLQNYKTDKKEVANMIINHLLKSLGDDWSNLELYEPYIQKQEMSMQMVLRDFYKNFHPIYKEVIYEAFVEFVANISLFLSQKK